MESLSVSSESTSKGAVLPIDLEAGESVKTQWQPGAERFSITGSRLSTATSASETVAKNGAGESAGQASKLTAAEGAQRQASPNPSGADSAEKLAEALNAAGRDKTKTAGEDSGFGTESLTREMKAGGGTASLGKTAAGRNLPGYLLNQVGRQIIRLRNAGENEMTLQLKPPHLGRMKLNIEHTAGGIKVGIVVESTAARDMLLANTHDLKTALADQGLRLDKIDVEAQADFDQSMAQAGRGFGQSGGRKGRWAEQRQANAGGLSDSPPVTENDAGGLDSGRLDLVA
jgi:flagellar hook-length control protein FliK